MIHVEALSYIKCELEAKTIVGGMRPVKKALTSRAK